MYEEMRKGMKSVELTRKCTAVVGFFVFFFFFRFANMSAVASSAAGASASPAKATDFLVFSKLYDAAIERCNDARHQREPRTTFSRDAKKKI
jgi:hypothetical protein